MSLTFLRAPLLALAIAATASACTPLRSHQGYVVDADLVNTIEPGVDNRESVAQTLGKPTLTSQFDDSTWYYVARETRNMAYNSPKPSGQTTIIIKFDSAGNVTSVGKTGADLIASVNPYGRKTPTLGRDNGFFEDLFGNIGTVGAPGTTGGTSGQ
jgi:outer membrane protein assembly factor BamE (lipoprotein component of BamABCDE complex)